MLSFSLPDPIFSPVSSSSYEKVPTTKIKLAPRSSCVHIDGKGADCSSAKKFMGRILEEMSSKSQLHMFFIGIILGIIVNNVYLTLPKYMENDEVSRKIENRVEIMEKQISEIENAPPPEIKCPEIQIPEKLEEIISQEKTIKYEKPSSLFKNIKEVLISDEFSAISAWDKSVPSEYGSVDKLYSEDKCDCGGGFQYTEKSTVDFNSTTKRRDSDFKSYMKNHIFEYVKSPLHVTGANT